MKEKIVRNFIIGVFATLYLVTSLISTVHVIDFFELSNPKWMAISLAVAFELGAAASLASLIALDKMNKTLVWLLFITITSMQVQGNLYFAFKNAHDYQSWIELFNLVDEDPLYQKRILAFVSGAILPLVALGFIKSLVDYIKPEKDQPQTLEENVESMRKVVDAHDSLVEEIEKKTEVEVSTEPSIEPIIEKPVSTVNDEIVAEPEIETLKQDSNIIKDAEDLNNYLNKTSDTGLINPIQQHRSVDHRDSKPTGFDHTSITH